MEAKTNVLSQQRISLVWWTSYLSMPMQRVWRTSLCRIFLFGAIWSEPKAKRLDENHDSQLSPKVMLEMAQCYATISSNLCSKQLTVRFFWWLHLILVRSRHLRVKMKKWLYAPVWLCNSNLCGSANGCKICPTPCSAAKFIKLRIFFFMSLGWAGSLRNLILLNGQYLWVKFGRIGGHRTYQCVVNVQVGGGGSKRSMWHWTHWSWKIPHAKIVSFHL